MQFERRPDRGFGSIETVSRVVRSNLPTDIIPKSRTCRFTSAGVVPRIYNILEAAARQEQVNHIIGDVHYLTLLMHRRQTVLTILDLVGLTRGAWLRRKIIEWLWYRLPIRRAAVITAISEATKHQLLELLGDDRVDIRVVPCCISTIFRPVAKPFAVDCPVVLAVGTAAHKNLDRLIVALRGIRCKLLIIGRLNESHQQELVHSEIRYESRQELNETEMLRAYAESDLLAFPSTYEGFGMPILEAQMVERPVITSAAASMPEVAGDGACLVDPYDHLSIRAGIFQVIQDSAYRRFLIRAGRLNRERFSPQVVAEAYARIYREIASGRSPTP